MAWEDRPHYRDRSGASVNPLQWLLSGSVPIGTLLGVRLRAHSSLLILLCGMVLLDWEKAYPFSVRGFTMAVWLIVLIAHELAHCLMARRLGGHADEALLWPAGGLLPAEPPRMASATFITAAAGPALNLLLCIGSASTIYLLAPPQALHTTVTVSHATLSLNPFHSPTLDAPAKWSDPAFYCTWIFVVNYRLLLLNLLPIFPLDGGRLFEAILWPLVGHFRAQLIETTVGMASAVALGLVSLAMQTLLGYLLAACMLYCCYQSYQSRMLLHETGSEDWKDSFDFGASLFSEERPRRRRLSRRVIRKARRIAQQEKAARDRVDAILAKVSLAGLVSLTWRERRTLRKTTEQQRRRENEMSQFQ
jgi:Zn-dependent protease